MYTTKTNVFGASKKAGRGWLVDLWLIAGWFLKGGEKGQKGAIWLQKCSFLGGYPSHFLPINANCKNGSIQSDGVKSVFRAFFTTVHYQIFAKKCQKRRKRAPLCRYTAEGVFSGFARLRGAQDAMCPEVSDSVPFAPRRAWVAGWFYWLVWRILVIWG